MDVKLFARDITKKDNLRSYCNSCNSKKRKISGYTVIKDGFKECRDCRVIKPISEFYKSAWGRDGVKGSCKVCYKRRVIPRKKTTEEKLFWSAKRRASLKGRYFELNISDIIIPKVCPLMGIPIYCGVKKSIDNSPTLDRLDNSKGYTKDNIWVISHKANWIKGTNTLEEIELFIKNLKLKLNG